MLNRTHRDTTTQMAALQTTANVSRPSIHSTLHTTIHGLQSPKGSWTFSCKVKTSKKTNKATLFPAFNFQHQLLRCSWGDDTNERQRVISQAVKARLCNSPDMMHVNGKSSKVLEKSFLQAMIFLVSWNILEELILKLLLEFNYI